MVEQSGINKIRAFKQRWIMYQTLACLLIAAATAVVVISLLHSLWQVALAYGLLVFVLLATFLLLIRQPWKIDDIDVARFLNARYPDLEESSELIIKPAAGLNLLENLQRSKTEQVLLGIKQPQQFTRLLKVSAVCFFVAIVLSFLIGKVNFESIRKPVSILCKTALNIKNAMPEKVLPQIASVDLAIMPPTYTGKPSRRQDRFNLEAEEGSRVSWTIKTNIAVGKLQLIFNEKEVIALHAINSDKTLWAAQKQVTTTGFYQVAIGSQLSDYYKIDVIKDAPPVIRIKTPKQYTYIDAGESTKVSLSVTLTDDYGITDAFIYATIAKGSGEAVKFKEQKIAFNESLSAHQKQYQLQKLLDLHTLDMEPGDELYFYVQAQDNHNQQTRTDIYIVSIQDTAKLLSLTGMTLGVSLVPEYFRSERQIILDTEKLLKDRDSISAERFKERCNNLGMDQKLLRLRYGKFLGEEEESSEGGGQAADGLNNAADFSNTQKIMDAYTDKHDNAEDANFLEKDTKTQLKNTLNEMWKAELNLRTFKAQDALPFEYKALRLLKDLQQKSRAYVAKTAYNPPPLKLVEKRLTGDLSKVGQPLQHQDIKQNADAYADLKKAASVLDAIKQTRVVAPLDIHTLQVAGAQLSTRATAQPMVYLPAVAAMRRILNSKPINLTDILKVETALQKALPSTNKAPQVGQNSADMGLSQSYYKNLIRLNK